jgi:hypothetical protein
MDIFSDRNLTPLISFNKKESFAATLLVTVRCQLLPIAGFAVIILSAVFYHVRQ